MLALNSLSRMKGGTPSMSQKHCPSWSSCRLDLRRKSIWVQEGQKAKCISPAQVYTKYTHWTRCKYHGLSTQHNCSCSCKAPKYGVFGYGTIQGYGCSPKTMTDILGKQLFLFFLLFARHTCGTALASRTSPWMQDRNSFPSLLLCHLQGS